MKDDSDVTADNKISVNALDGYLDHLFDSLKSMGNYVISI